MVPLGGAVQSNLCSPYSARSLAQSGHTPHLVITWFSRRIYGSPCNDSSRMSGLLKPFRRRRQEKQPGTPRTKTPEPATSPRPRIERSGGTGLPQQALPQIYEYLDVSKDSNPLLVESKKQYNEAIMAFDKVFELYGSKKPGVINLNANGITEATHRALSCSDPSQSGKVFGEAVQRILQTAKADQMQPSVGKQVCSVLSKLFPLMKLALGLTETVADV
jgi:hypothetical protein